MNQYFSIKIVNGFMILAYSILFLLISFKMGNKRKRMNLDNELAEKRRLAKKAEDDDYVKRRLKDINNIFTDRKSNTEQSELDSSVSASNST